MAQGIHGDPGCKVEVARAVLGDEPGPFAPDEGKGCTVVGGQQDRNHQTEPEA